MYTHIHIHIYTYIYIYIYIHTHTYIYHTQNTKTQNSKKVRSFPFILCVKADIKNTPASYRIESKATRYVLSKGCSKTTKYQK